MKRSLCLLTLALVGMVTADSLQARIWTDSSGHYTVEAELFAFNNEHVILQRQDGHLGMYKTDILSDKDKEFLKSSDATALSHSNLQGEQTWTMKDGMNVVGQVVDYAKVNVTIQRRRSKAYINDRQFRDLPPIYQTIILESLEELEGLKEPTEKEFQRWLRLQKGEPRTFEIEGVVMELKDGNEYTVPFFLFSEENLPVLKSGWDAWLASMEDYEEQNDESFRLQSQAAAMHRQQQFDRQVAIADLQLKSVIAGITRLWEVTMVPANGYGPWRWVVVPGHDSAQASDMVRQQFPGYVISSVRKVSGNW